MKLLHLFNQYLPPTENWAYNLIRYLPEVENHIAARHYLKHNYYAPEFKFAESYLDGVVAYNNSLDKSKPTEFFQKVVVHSLPFLLGSDETRLIRYARENEITILHAHFAPVGWYYRNITEVLGIPYVISFYGYDYGMIPHTKPVFRQRYRQLFDLADAFVCEGPYGASVLEQMGCPPEKVHVVPLGVEVEKIAFFQRKKKPGELKLVQVASFAEKKGQIYTVRAFAEALKVCPNMELTFVGNEREPLIKKRILDFIIENGLTEKVKIIDWLDYSKLHQFLGEYHVFIHPSCYAQNRDCEGGAPVILLDAQGTGMPVISTYHCDIPFLVTDQHTGYLTAEKDIELLKDAILKFCKMEEGEYHTLQINARKAVVQRFNLDELARKLFLLYKRL